MAFLTALRRDVQHAPPRPLVWVIVIGVTFSTASCSTQSSPPDTPSTPRPAVTSTPEPEPDRAFDTLEIDPALLSPAAMGLGNARVTDSDGYAVDFGWSGSIGVVTADPTTNKPGETTISVPVRFAAVLHNVTAERETPMSALAGVKLVPVWAADSPLCQAMVAPGGSSDSANCRVGAVSLPLSGPLAVDSWNASWTDDVMTIVVPESTAEAVLQAAASPAAWILTGPDQFATWVLDNGQQAVEPMGNTWWTSAATAGISAPLVGSVDPASVDIDTTLAGSAVTALLELNPEKNTFGCPVLPTGAATIAPLTSLWGFDSSLPFSEVFVWGIEPPAFECHTADGAAGGLTVRVEVGAASLVDPQQIANESDSSLLASQQIPLYGGTLVLTQYGSSNAWAVWSDDQVSIRAIVSQDADWTTEEKFVRAGQWAVANLPTMLESLATYTP